MAIVTERAKQELSRMLATATVGDAAACLRLASGEPGQFGLILDKEKEGDQAVEHEGTKVLLIGPELARTLERMTIDCEESAGGPCFVIFEE